MIILHLTRVIHTNTHKAYLIKRHRQVTFWRQTKVKHEKPLMQIFTQH